MESETAKLLQRRAKQVRELRGYTQEMVAEKSTLKYKHYQSVEAGRKPDIRISTLEKIANGLEVEPWELLMPAELVPAVAESLAKYYKSPARKPRKK